MIFDISISELYSMMYTMKKESGFNLDEIYEMYPFELEIFHNLCVKDIKDRLEMKKQIARG